MKLNGTNTYRNMQVALAGESQACLRYSLYAEAAEREGNLQIAGLFRNMEKNEREHAKIWYQYLNGGIDDSITNLERSAKSENEEWKSTYPQFAKAAREEGLEQIAMMFERIAAIEFDHERSFLEAIFHLTKEESEEETEPAGMEKEKEYYCVFCGHMEPKPLPVCPVCSGTNCFSQ